MNYKIMSCLFYCYLEISGKCCNPVRNSDSFEEVKLRVNCEAKQLKRLQEYQKEIGTKVECLAFKNLKHHTVNLKNERNSKEL